ncbi:hypothetical protein KM1_073000 [Entamoeba histolytica HM-3:IMSS]|uniref:Uncharacterized protein n=1 Tax=Entamoeba histolytica HM-3:IMSS TaxID=885315 RepID=M7WLY0_ENTHI|nr:hypothetical protein KM1_045100 [Entamoeba histolytica HM-3:IMSS]EMS14680.1 hypothetical protein KM1_073000 [Entamoeba histolytica HM-3:IMSS]
MGLVSPELGRIDENSINT